MLAKLAEIREARSKACAGIMDAEDIHDNEAQQGHIAYLDRLRIEEVVVLRELKNLPEEDAEEAVKQKEIRECHFVLFATK